jgi:hypothetical protein
MHLKGREQKIFIHTGFLILILKQISSAPGKANKTLRDNLPSFIE